MKLKNLSASHFSCWLRGGTVPTACPAGETIEVDPEDAATILKLGRFEVIGDKPPKLKPDLG